MKYLFNFLENLLHIGELIGFYISKGINKFFYGLIFSSFDESKEKLKIEEKRISTLRQELENKKNAIELDQRKYKEKIKDVEILLKAKGITSEEFVKLQEELKEARRKLRHKDEHIIELESELKRLGVIQKMFETYKKKSEDIETGNIKSSDVDTEEYKRLQEKITLLENEVKILKADDNYRGEKLITKLKDVKEPVFKKTKNPFKYISNYLQYRKDKKGFEGIVSKYIDLQKKNGKNRDKRYMMESIKEDDRYIRVGDKYLRIYYLADIPDYLIATTLFRIINIPVPLTLSYHISGTSKGAMMKAAKRRENVLQAQQDERINKGKTVDQGIERQLEEAKALIAELLRIGGEQVFLISMYAVISADSKKKLIEYDQLFQTEASDIEFTFNTYTFGQQKAFYSTVPLCVDTAKQEHFFQTSAVINLLPFLTRNLNDPQGIFIGTNHYNSSLILIDLFKSGGSAIRNANVNIFGSSGSGKSVTSKILITRLMMRGVQNIILDPEGEYVSLTEALGGEVIKFSRDSGINPFFIGKASRDAQKDHISVLKHFFKFFIQQKRYDSAKLDKLLQETYDSGEPVFSNFLKIVKEHAKEDEGIDFVEDLEQLQSGSLSGIFNSEKSLNLKSDVICFDLSDLKTDEKKIPAMYLLGTIINRLIDDKSGKRKMIFIDESHKLLVNEATTNFYIDLVKTARKRKAGVVSITQNPEDFKEHNNSKTILTQAETSILLKLAPASVQYIEEKRLFQLTERELNDLPTFSIGEALFIREKEHIHIDIYPFETERNLVFTN